MGKKNKEEEEQIYEAFFSGLPYESKEDDLIEFIGGNEGIISIRMPRYQDTGRCRGYAHIKFSSHQAYDNALKQDGKQIGSRYIKIEPAKGEKQQEKPPEIPVGCKSLFVKGLPYQIKEAELKKQFSSCGNISDIRMVRNWANKNFKGFAYIDYKDLGSVKKAINKYHNKFFQGRKLKCDGVSTSMKGGFKKRTPEEEQDND